MHRLLALRARLRRGASAFALTIEGRGFESRMVAGMRISSPRMRVLQRLRAGLSDRRCLRNQYLPRACQASAVTTCAYCGVGCSFKAEVKGDS
jgi:formate dehydrogenase major subunit